MPGNFAGNDGAPPRPGIPGGKPSASGTWALIARSARNSRLGVAGTALIWTTLTAGSR